MNAALPAQIGEVISGYRLDAVLGQGGMGCVFRATHVRLGRRVAVKILASGLAAESEYVSRFLHEAKIVNDVRHPNIVDISDFIETENPRRVAYVMEFIEGPSLGSVLKTRRLTVRQAVNASLQASAALKAVHAVNVVHRDLKPDNILVVGSLQTDLSASPSVKILDFGIAKSSDPNAQHKTATGSMLGTPSYMAPEQIAGGAVSAATDVYAVGEIFYEMLTGKRVFSGEPVTILKSKFMGQVPVLSFPSDVVGGDAIKAIVTACLATEVRDRPTLDDFCGALHDILAIQPETGDIQAAYIDADALADTMTPSRAAAQPASMKRTPLSHPSSVKPTPVPGGASRAPIHRQSSVKPVATPRSGPAEPALPPEPALVLPDVAHGPHSVAPTPLGLVTGAALPVPRRSKLYVSLGGASLVVAVAVVWIATTRAPAMQEEALSEQAPIGVPLPSPDPVPVGRADPNPKPSPTPIAPPSPGAAPGAQAEAAPGATTPTTDPSANPGGTSNGRPSGAPNPQEDKPAGGRRSEPAAPHRTVVLKTTPRGAQVIDASTGAVLGTSPITIKLDAGKPRRKLEIRLSGYVPASVEIGPETKNLTVALAAVSSPSSAPPPAAARPAHPEAAKPPVEPSRDASPKPSGPIKKKQLKSW